MKLVLDHLVFAATDLESGARHVADLLGAAPQAGGSHPAMGTHNRLLGLFGGLYLEIIAIDPEAAAPQRPRWFGLDSAAVHERLRDGPFLLHWVARVERPTDLSQWQAQYPAQIAPVIPMTRGDLRWLIAVPDDGALPGWQAADGSTALAGDGLVPTLIQWDVPVHPSSRLERQDLLLKRLTGVHPDAGALQQAISWLNAADLITLRPPQAGEAVGLEAEIETPAGLRVLR